MTDTDRIEHEQTDKLERTVQRLIPQRYRPALRAHRLLTKYQDDKEKRLTQPKEQEANVAPKKKPRSKLASYVLYKVAARSYADPSDSTDAGDITSTLLGGIPLVGPAAAGLSSGYMTPRNNTSVGAMTTAGSAFGQAAGGLGGAALGAGLGAGGVALAKHMGWDLGIAPKDAAILGGLLGGSLGLVGGGAYGASRGRNATESAAMKNEIRGIVAQQLAEVKQRKQQARIQHALRGARRQGAQIGAQRGMQLYARKLHEAMQQRRGAPVATRDGQRGYVQMQRR